jgi:hypothetical protein
MHLQRESSAAPSAPHEIAGAGVEFLNSAGYTLRETTARIRRIERNFRLCACGLSVRRLERDVS